MNQNYHTNIPVDKYKNSLEVSKIFAPSIKTDYPFLEGV